MSVQGLNPAAIPTHKLVLAATVTAAPPPTPTAPMLPAPAPTPLMTATEPGPSGTTIAPVTPANSGAADEWEPPEPEPDSYRTQTEYWKRKFELAVSAAREFRAQLFAVQNTPLTLKEHHPSFQLRQAAARDPEERARGQQRVKGAWGDMGCDGLDGTLMEKMLDEQEENEKQKKEEMAQRKRDAEARRVEREVDAEKKKQEKEA